MWWCSDCSTRISTLWTPNRCCKLGDPIVILPYSEDIYKIYHTLLIGPALAGLFTVSISDLLIVHTVPVPGNLSLVIIPISLTVLLSTEIITLLASFRGGATPSNISYDQWETSIRSCWLWKASISSYWPMKEQFQIILTNKRPVLTNFDQWENSIRSYWPMRDQYETLGQEYNPYIG